MNILSLQQHLQRLHNNRIFELAVVAIIIFSALVIGVKTYDLPSRFITLMHWLDFGVTLFFLLEISIRFIATEHKRDFFKSGWNVFDTLIVTVSLLPFEDSEMAFIGRLIRIFRVLRMVSIIPELRMLLNSLLKALPQLGYVMLLMFIIFYIYAAIGATFFHGINDQLWGDILLSLLTLFRVMTFEDWTDVMYETMAIYPLSWLYYLSFIFLTAFAFLNMVIGIVVNVMNEEHERARESEQTAPAVTLEQLQLEIRELKAILQKARP
ncbi:MAG: ion transporter [Pseudomonadota bacterium]